MKIEERRNRYFDGNTIALELDSYVRKHNGAVPRSFEELELAEDVDVSAFRILPPGSRVGRYEKDVFAEGKEAENDTWGKRMRIVIYVDGMIKIE